MNDKTKPTDFNKSKNFGVLLALLIGVFISQPLLAHYGHWGTTALNGILLLALLSADEHSSRREQTAGSGFRLLDCWPGLGTCLYVERNAPRGIFPGACT